MIRSHSRADRVAALHVAIAAVVVGSFLPWTQHVQSTVRGTDGAGNLTLLLGGAALAMIVRWRLGGGGRQGFLSAGLALSAATAVVLLTDLASMAHEPAAAPRSGIFVATAGALFATALATALLRDAR